MKSNLCVMAQGFPEYRSALEELGLTVLEASPLDELPAPAAAHADMQLHDLGGGKVIVARGAHKLKKHLKKLGYTVLEENGVAPFYPKDAALNCFVLDGALYCNPKSVSASIVEHYCSTGREVVPVKQGYTKCSTCIVSEHALITADHSIAKAAGARGVDTLVISSGHILLPGYDCGFIGGAAGLLDEKRLALCGSLDYHPDGSSIRRFCKYHGVRIVELADTELTDIGGIITLRAPLQ